jgi:ribose-phosphate pyrophosphokinase
MKPMVLAYPGNESMGETLRAALDAEPVGFAMRQFPDGETYLRIDTDVADRAVALVCTLHNPDEKLLPLVFMTSTLRELGVRSIGLVTPYLAYMRQDRRFQPGEALTSLSFARLLSAQFDWLATVDPHLHRRQSLAEIYTIPTAIVHAAPLLARWIRDHVKDPLVVGPDAESEQWVRAVAEAVPCPHIVLEKTRGGDREVAVVGMPDSAAIAGHSPVLVDDIVSSAGTMIEAVKLLRASGLPAPACVTVHGVFAPGAYEGLQEAGADRIVTTNSIQHASSEIDLAAVLAEPIRRLLSGKRTAQHRFPLEFASTVLVAAPVRDVFEYVDDHVRLSSHMSGGSWMMGGGSMAVKVDAGQGRTVGSRIGLRGKVFGIRLDAEEVVVERTAPIRKFWETIGEPRLLVIGSYRMGFELEDLGDLSRLQVTIAYRLPASRGARWLSVLFGRSYARWCTRRMSENARQHFTAGSSR